MIENQTMGDSRKVENQNTKSSKDRRTSTMINPPFQLRIIIYVLVMGLITILTIYGIHVYLFWKLHGIGETLAFQPDHLYFRLLSEQRTTIGSLFIVTAVFLLDLMFIFGLIISAKIAGPIRRLERHLLAIADGRREPGEVHFREDDFFQELAAAYNRQYRKKK